MTFLTLHPSKVIDVIREALGTPTKGVSFFLNPVPASRPKVARRGNFMSVYYGKNHTNWEKTVKELVSTQLDTIDSFCTVLVEHIVEKAKTSKKMFPRGDVDNYAKLSLDMLTHKQFWKDDDLVTGLWSSKRFAEPDEEPRTEVTIYAHSEPRTN